MIHGQQNVKFIEAMSCSSSPLVSGYTSLFSVTAIVKKLAEEDKYQ
jgi:hypothetical protein